MRILLSGIITILFSVSALAAGGGSMPGAGKVSVMGYYGLVSINPSDFNTIATTSTPAGNSISTGTLYGGGLSYNLANGKLGFDVQYEVLTANNYKSVNGTNVGWNITQNNVNVGVDYFLVNREALEFRVGVAVIVPTYSHATFQTVGANFDYDTDKALGYGANAGVGFHLGQHVNLFIEGGYVFLKTSSPKTSSGTVLTTSSGATANLDLSGIRAVAGLEFFL